MDTKAYPRSRAQATPQHGGRRGGSITPSLLEDRSPVVRLHMLSKHGSPRGPRSDDSRSIPHGFFTTFHCISHSRSPMSDSAWAKLSKHARHSSNKLLMHVYLSRCSTSYGDAQTPLTIHMRRYDLIHNRAIAWVPQGTCSRRLA